MFEWDRDPSPIAPLRSFGVISGGSYIPSTRDTLAAKFLETGCSHSLWIDDDMAPKYANIARLIAIATQTGAPFVSAAYTEKTARSLVVGNPLAGPAAPMKGLVEMRHVGFGCALIARTVFETLAPSCQRYSPRPDGPQLRGYFFPDRPGDSEDLAFCRRATAAGFRILMDCDSLVPHIGRAAYPLALESTPEISVACSPRTRQT